MSHIEQQLKLDDIALWSHNQVFPYASAHPKCENPPRRVKPVELLVRDLGQYLRIKRMDRNKQPELRETVHRVLSQ